MSARVTYPGNREEPEEIENLCDVCGTVCDDSGPVRCDNCDGDLCKDHAEEWFEASSGFSYCRRCYMERFSDDYPELYERFLAMEVELVTLRRQVAERRAA